MELVTASAVAQPPNLRGLGFLPGGNISGAQAASPDGTIIAGASSSLNSGPGDTAEAYRWTLSGGMVGLGDLPGGTFLSTAEDMTPDGRVIVGWGRTSFGQEAYRWTAETGMAPLGILPDYTLSFATRVSRDGTIIAGTNGSYITQGFQAFRWTADGGMVGLGTLPGFNGSLAEGMSADGSVIVGRSQGNGLPQKAFRWTAATGIQPLPGDFASQAFAVSSDGHVAVGSGMNDRGPYAVAWRDDGQIINIGTLDQSFGEAYGVSGDGSLVVGTSSIPGPFLVQTAFIWDSAHGIRNLQDVLTQDYGFDLSGWHLTEANWVSDDGSIILGSGRNADGHLEAWVAILPEPGPATFLLLAFALLLRRRRAIRI